jgi:HEAT repeat protein
MGFEERRLNLIELLQDEDPAVQQSASDALELLDAYQNLEQFVQEIKQNHTPRQVQAVYGLGRMISQQAYRLLAQLLKHPKLDVSAAAARVLLTRRDPRLLKGLLELYREVHPLIKESLLELFSFFRDPRAVEIILFEIEGYEGELLLKAIETLGEIGDPRSEYLLLQYIRHKDPQVRAKAAKALGKLFAD